MSMCHISNAAAEASGIRAANPVEERSQKTRSPEIDFCRTFSNVLVVLIHARIVLGYIESDALVSALTGPVAFIAMPLLFYVSGYLNAQSMLRHSYRERLSRSFWRLLMPYLSWNIIFVVIYLITAYFIPSSYRHMIEWHLATFSGAIRRIAHLWETPCDAPFWYVRTLIYLTVISPLLKIFSKNRFRMICFVLFLLVWYVFSTKSAIRPWAEYILPWYGIAAYLLGIIVSATGYGISTPCRNRWIVLASGTCLVIEIAYILLEKQIPYRLETLCRFLEVPIALFCATRLFGCVGRSRAYLTLQKSSFFIYATHFLVCSLVFHAVRTAFPSLIPIPEIGVFLYVVGGIALMCIVRYGAERFIPRVLRVLEGGGGEEGL